MKNKEEETNFLNNKGHKKFIIMGNCTLDYIRKAREESKYDSWSSMK